jgi:hypothetical protein
MAFDDHVHRTSWIVVGMARAKLAALRESAGVLNAAALAVVPCGAEPLLVCVVRVLEERNRQEDERCHDAHGIFEDSAHSASQPLAGSARRRARLEKTYYGFR